MLAFMVQCCREMARGDDDMAQIPNSETKPSAIGANPMIIEGLDSQALLSPGQLLQERAFQKNAYLMDTKLKSFDMGRKTPQGLKH